MNKLPVRKQTRLKGFVYSEQGYYFVTICTQDMKCILGNIVDNKMILNDVGKIVENVLKTLPDRFPVKLDIYQIMPNHIHLIIAIVPPAAPVGVQFIEPVMHETGAMNCNNTGAMNCAPTGTPTLGQIIRHFKAKSSFLIGKHIFQRNYYDRIIRNEEEYYKIIEYIELNPEMWERDRNNPNHIAIPTNPVGV